jgi:hypothetical protein
LVYEIPEHPDMVAKVDYTILQRVADFNAKRGQSIETLSPEVKDAAEKSIVMERRRLLELRDYFGREHMVPQKVAFMQVPMSPDLAQELSEKRRLSQPITIDKNTDIWTIVRLQKKSAALADPERKTLLAGYAEHWDEIDEAEYWKITERLVGGENKEEFAPEPEGLFKIQTNRPLHNLLEAAKEDVALNEAIQDCLKNAIRYANETGNILDLAGEDNLVFSKRADGNWGYFLVDAFENQPMILTKADEALGNLIRGDELEPAAYNHILNAINFIRTVNGTAEILGLSDRIKLKSDISELDKRTKHKLLEKLKSE